MIALLLAISCGSERVDVKNLRDAGAAHLTTPMQSYVHELVNMRPPRWANHARRRQVERHVLKLEVEVLAFKHEADGDIHAIIRDAGAAGDFGSPSGRRAALMVAEFPAPACVLGSPYASRMTRARAAFLRLMKAHRSHLRLTGVIFFDKVHGQIGGAPNGIELHPVLEVRRLP